MAAERIILGVDPGTQITGHGVIRLRQGAPAELLDAGVIRLAGGDEHPRKLSIILAELTTLIEQHLPDELAIEAPFYGRNLQSMLKLGRVQGVVMAAAMARDIPVAEYAPSKVKKAVTGNGRASKHQVGQLCRQHLPQLQEQAALPAADATDALAVALCHAFQQGAAAGGTGRRYADWKAFVHANRGRTSD